MTGRLEGKVALITGTGGGQGREAALGFSAEGARVFGCDLKADGAEETVEMVRAAGGEMTSIAPLDLTSEEQVARLIDAAVSAYGGFDILWNNAAALRMAPTENLSLEDFEFTMSNEVTNLFLAIKASIPVFRRRGAGVILNTGSISARLGAGVVGNVPGMLAHGIAKAGVVRMSQVLAVELAPLNIRVNSISPGVIETPALVPFIGTEDKPTKVRGHFIDHLLVRRIGTSRDIVDGAIYLVSDEAQYVTGIDLVIDGGWTASGGMGLPDDAVAKAMEDAASAFFG